MDLWGITQATDGTLISWEGVHMHQSNMPSLLSVFTVAAVLSVDSAIKQASKRRYGT